MIRLAVDDAEYMELLCLVAAELEYDCYQAMEDDLMAMNSSGDPALWPMINLITDRLAELLDYDRKLGRARRLLLLC